MPLQARVDLSERIELAALDLALLIQHGVLRGDGVAFTHHHARAGEGGQIDFLVIEPGKHVDYRQRPARMANSGLVNHGDDLAAGGKRVGFQFINVHVHSFLGQHFTDVVHDQTQSDEVGFREAGA